MSRAKEIYYASRLCESKENLSGSAYKQELCNVLFKIAKLDSPKWERKDVRPRSMDVVYPNGTHFYLYQFRLEDGSMLEALTDPNENVLEFAAYDKIN